MHAKANKEWENTPENCNTLWKGLYVSPYTKVFTPDKHEHYDHTVKMLHYTIIFQQIFNLINSRKIDEELNVFSHFCNNIWFIVIFVLTIVIQMIMVEIGGRFTKTYALDTT